MTSIPSDLRVDESYRNTNDWTQDEDVFGRYFRFADGKGVNNVAGFRPKSVVGKSTRIEDCGFCLLVTNWGETEWPDAADRENGLFTYFGDNRKAGKELHDTEVRGNRLLQHVFQQLHVGNRQEIPPFLAFEKYRDGAGTQMRFLGLCCPGVQGLSSMEDLVAVWRVTGNERFQNYRATFTILASETVSKSWLEDMVQGVLAADSVHCPPEWRRWVKSGLYTPLLCERTVVPRTRAAQLPKSDVERIVLDKVYNGLSDREFEFAAESLVQLMDARFTDLQVTRAVRDGGRDVVGRYRVGHDEHQIRLDAFVEAKRWDPSSAVGVKPMMRLISRLKHRDVGVFVTTSFFDKQVQQELIDDNHPVLLVSGGDIARLLLSKDIDLSEGEGKLNGWLNAIRTKAAGS